MSAYDPPTEDLPIFDSALFSADTDILTIAKANTLYLKFPTAQGNEFLQSVNIAGTTTATGLITANGGLTMGGSNNITLGSGAVAPTSAQLGYIYNATYQGNTPDTTINSATSKLYGELYLLAGTYILSASISFVGTTLPSSATIAGFLYDTANIGVTKIGSGAIASGEVYTMLLTSFYNTTTAKTISVNVYADFSSGTLETSANDFMFKAIRIA